MDLIREELLSGLQRIEIPIFLSCPLFKKRLLETIQSLIGTQSQKTVDLIRQLLSMELNYVNVRHPDFIGIHMERVRVEATARVKKQLMELKSRDVPTFTLPVVEGWLDKRNKFHKYQRRFAQIQNRILTYAHNSSISDPSSEPHSFRLDGAEARILEKNNATGEFVFEVVADGRQLQFRTNQETVAENWVNWVIACSNEKRFQDTLRQFITTEDKDEDAERILNDPVELEKRVSAEIVKSILSSYYEIVRRKLIDEVPKAIMFMLVNKVKEMMIPEVVKGLFNDATIVDMLAEDPKITKKREETQQAIVYLDEAIDKINYMQASGDLSQDD